MPSKIENNELGFLHLLSKDIYDMFTTGKYSDLVIIVGNEKFLCHKVILRVRSPGFAEMLDEKCHCPLKECSCAELQLTGFRPDLVKIILEYIYKGTLRITNCSVNDILELLFLGHKFLMNNEDLLQILCDTIYNRIAIDNVVIVINAAETLNNEEIKEKCYRLMDSNAVEFVAHDTFLNLSKVFLISLLKRNSFMLPEVEIFKAVVKWLVHNEDHDDSILNFVRLPLRNLRESLSRVEISNLDKWKIILQTSQILTEKPLPTRGRLLPDTNLADSKLGATVTMGINGDNLLDDSANYTYHEIGKDAIILKLGMPSFINNIRMRLNDTTLIFYSYYVEVSTDSNSWIRVIDYDKYHCRSWQDLFFEPQIVEYIKIVGTSCSTLEQMSSNSTQFTLVALMASHKTNVPIVENQIICPTDSVALLMKGATMIEGLSKPANKILDGNSTDYGPHLGYAYHDTTSESAIVIHFAQPYIISNMKLLLWDKDERHYNYYVEVSSDKSQWETIVDNREAVCKSWQIFKFRPRPVSFVKLKGTFNSENQYFHWVYIECPVEESKPKIKGSEVNSK